MNSPGDERADALAARLSSLAPARPSLSREAMLFAAGRAAGEAGLESVRRRSRWLAMSTVTSVAAAVMMAVQLSVNVWFVDQDGSLPTVADGVADDTFEMRIVTDSDTWRLGQRALLLAELRRGGSTMVNEVMPIDGALSEAREGVLYSGWRGELSDL